MNQSFDSYVSAVSGYIPPVLISPENYSEIRNIAALFPAKLSTFFGFECRLGEASPEADFLLHVQASEGGCAVLAGADADNPLPAFTQQDPVWRRVTAFSKGWAAADNILHRNADHVWLEFDVAGEKMTFPPVPSFFFGPRKPGDSPSHDDNEQDNRWIADKALNVLLGQNLPVPFAEKILQTFEYLPDNARVFQIGTMLSRPLQAIRICIKNILPEQIIPYLSAIRWQGPLEDVRELTAGLSGFADRIALDIDVIHGRVPQIGPKLGFECYIDESLPDTQQWEAFFDYLIGQGVCLRDKCEGLLAYPGHMDEWTHREVWPKHLLDLSALMGIHTSSVLKRTIHHVKVVYRQSAPLEVKAYLGVFHAWGKTLFEKADK